MSEADKKKGVNLGYVTSYICILAIGMVQFGYTIAGFNSLKLVTEHRWGYTSDNQTTFQQGYAIILTTCTNAGAMLACLFVGKLMSYGKWNLILLANAIYDVGVIITLINSPSVILVGRFIQGISAGSFTVLTPKFIDELAPLEYKGSFGTISQLGCTLGIFLVAAFCLPIPSDEAELQDGTFIVDQYWRVVWGFPLLLSAIQVTLMVTVFKYDTPTTLKQRGDTDRLVELLSKVYKREQVQWRMDEIVVTETGHTNDGGNASLKVQKIGMFENFTHPDTKWAAWMGCTMSAFQQLTGINAIMFYSSSLFADSNIAGNTQTAIIMFVNMVSVLGATSMLDKMGRKSVMILWTFMCAVFMVINGVAVGGSYGLLQLISTLCYVAAFEFGPGPVPWLYMGEIMTNEGLQVAVFINWLFTLIIGVVTTPWSNATPAGIFYVFGLICLLQAIFYYFFMKETKGLSQEQVKILYSEERRKESDDGSDPEETNQMD